jgi:hypothetical protein
MRLVIPQRPLNILVRGYGNYACKVRDTDILHDQGQEKTGWEGWENLIGYSNSQIALDFILTSLTVLFLLSKSCSG